MPDEQTSRYRLDGMYQGRKELIFDTSGINSLTDEPERDLLLHGVRSGYVVRITETSLSEIIASPDEKRRNELLGTVKRLLMSGFCIIPFSIIIEKQAREYLVNRDAFDWINVDVRSLDAEKEIFRKDIVERISNHTRRELRRWDKAFNAIFSEAKPAFRRLFDSGCDQRPSFEVIAGRLMASDGAYRQIAARLFARATDSQLSGADLQDFLERCPPFKAVLMAVCFSQYDRCIRDERQASRGKAGRLDMFSAAYLPYSSLFVTNDSGQCKALKAVAKMIAGDTDLLMFQEFKSRVFGPASWSTSCHRSDE